MISFSKIYHIMGLSYFRAISGIGIGMGWIGLDLCVGLFYEHRFAMLIRISYKLAYSTMIGFCLRCSEPCQRDINSQMPPGHRFQLSSDKNAIVERSAR